MMGQLSSGQERLFYSFNIEDHRCMDAGLVKGEGFAVDASIIKADASRRRSDFQWNEEVHEYRCPTGHALRSEWRAFKNQRSHITKADTIIFRSRQADCSKCSIKERCCPNTSFRKIARSVHEAAR
ncbi:hypothetical protein PMHK_00760 [Pseudomonas sp. MHK4]|jgi:hypothetical protein